MLAQAQKAARIGSIERVAAFVGSLAGANPEVLADWVRPGIALYGSSPDFPEHHIAHWGLQPTMSLRSRLIATQSLQAGDTVGYGSTFQADAPMQIGRASCRERVSSPV